jgi:hypothetical protein
VPCGRWRAEQQEYVPVRPTCCIQSQLSAATKSDGSYHQSSLLCYGKSRITATTYNLFADKSTFEAKHRSYCTKFLFDSKSMDPSDANSPHDPLIYKEIDVAQKSSVICVTWVVDVFSDNKSRVAKI